MLSYALYPVLSGNAPTETIPHFSDIIAKNMMTGLYPMTASLQAIRGFFSGQTTHDCIEEYARTLIEGLGELANAFVNQFNTGVTTQDEKMIEEAEWMIQEWALTVISMCEYFDLTESTLYITLSKTESFVNALCNILALTLPEPSKGPMENNIIALTETKHHVGLNVTKSKTLAAMNMILGNINESKRKILS